MNARHLSTTAEHGSPPHIIEGGRNLMGGVIHCDPASSAFWNRRVHAEVYYDKRANGLDPRRRWFGNVFLNPPGDASGGLVQAFWMRLVNEWLLGNVVQAVWVGFSVGQFVTLQGLPQDDWWPIALPPPLAFPTVIPARRFAYRKRVNRHRSRRAANPPHASYVTWLPPRNMYWPITTASGRKLLLADAVYTERTQTMFTNHFGYLGTIAQSIAVEAA